MSEPAEAASDASDRTQIWSGPESDRDLSGKTLGDFQVERLLGRGGMGEVYLARQLSLNRPVALKVLRRDLLAKPSYLGRFKAEAAAIAKLNHPNIVHVYTQDEVEGVRFIAMEYVLGTNLRDYILKKGGLDYPLALSIMRQAGMAVGAAGEIGLIHRDLKPENLLLTKKGQVKVADFGLCRDLDGEPLNLTQSGITMGTPLYMSPEQAQGHAVDHRSDLYSLGVTFYHMIAGAPPFKAETALAVALKHVKDQPVSLAVHRPDIPPDLDRLVLKLMSKRPADRYQTAGDMLRDLARVKASMEAQLGGAVPAPSDVSVSARVVPVEPLPSTTSAPAPPPAPSPARAKAIANEAGSEEESAPLEPASAWFGKGVGVSLVSLGLILGAFLGWFGRTPDLLGSTAVTPKAMPGLWLAPEWSKVPRLASPESQYRDAQLRAPVDGIEAAWLAVPGHFPASREWSARAYTQLCRLLLRRHDAERLSAIAAEIESWDQAQTHERDLAHIARTGVSAIGDDLDGVLKAFAKPAFDPDKLTDPALLELAFEVTMEADRAVARPGGTSDPGLTRPGLRQIQMELARRLVQADPRAPLGIGPGRIDPRGKAGRPLVRP